MAARHLTIPSRLPDEVAEVVEQLFQLEQSEAALVSEVERLRKELDVAADGLGELRKKIRVAELNLKRVALTAHLRRDPS